MNIKTSFKSISQLKEYDFYQLAKIIDSNFDGKMGTFKVIKKSNYFTLNTNKQGCSLIRIYFEDGCLIDIKRLSGYMGDWQKITSISILDEVNRYFTTNGFRSIQFHTP